MGPELPPAPITIIGMLAVFDLRTGDAIISAGPHPQVNHLASFRAERAMTVGGARVDGLPANWAAHYDSSEKNLTDSAEARNPHLARC